MSLLNTCTVCLLATLVSVAGQTSATPSPAEVARSMQKKDDTVKDVSADFVQLYEGGPRKRKREERGTLLVKKPGKMRWAYKAPDEKVFVSDGTRLYQHFPQENRVIVGPAPE